jgi:hypothetical protein
MGFRISQVVTSAAVASAGTIAFSFPAGTTMGHFNLNTSAHKLYVEGHNSQYNFLDDFTISFATAAATVTYNGSTPIPANTKVLLMLEMSGQNDQRQMLDGAEINGYPGQVNSVSAAIAGGSTSQPIGVRSPILIARFGSPSTISTTAVLSAATLTVTTLQTLATRVVFDVARAVQIVAGTAGDTTQVVTIRGFDMYGAAMSEAITANGTTPVFGKKAFKEVTSYQTSLAFTTTLSIGNSKIIGIPWFLPGSAYVLKEIQDGAVASAGTFVAGVSVKQTSTSGDPRGTWTPAATLNGTIALELALITPDPTYMGGTQYSS